MHDLFFISAGQKDVKKSPNIINKKNLYLNYGLLGLASIAKRSGFNPILLHGNFSSPDDFLNECITLGIGYTKKPVFISMPSFYALSWLKEFTEKLKSKFPSTHIILGGRWVIDGQSELLHNELPVVSSIIDGLGEKAIIEILNINESQPSYPCLDYTVLHRRHLYQAAIEVSRGCGQGCSFCQERNEKLLAPKDPKIIIDEAKNILPHDNLNKMNIYFEASLFQPNAAWTKKLIEQQNNNSCFFDWRAESRVDKFRTEIIPLLAKSGLKVLDLGLESASPVQLERMGKTSRPEEYLGRASDLLYALNESGIHVKINILLFAGENKFTIRETYNWLEAHKKLIKGVSVGPVIAFGWDDNKRDFIKRLSSFGADALPTKQIGITHLNLSKEITYHDSLRISKEISKSFMTADDYYYLKSFSYFPRDYTYIDFMNDVDQENDDYSFSTSKGKLYETHVLK
ncbi:B12-binding domain-containing radical SAM protein [Aeromonas veronii]|uniref:B12-binding domain-containing radical SAM protein n=1 Tax=Aeromonas veronii TaxID=654 RepID=UPI003BA3625B